MDERNLAFSLVALVILLFLVMEYRLFKHRGFRNVIRWPKWPHFWCRKYCGPAPKAGSIPFKVFINGFTVTGVNMSFVMRADEQIKFRPIFEDKYGNEADEIGSVPLWSITDESIGTLVVSEDGREATFLPSGKKGPVRVDVLVDADPGVAEVPLSGYADIIVLSGMAISIRLNGVLSPKDSEPEPTPQPTETPAPTPEPTPEPTVEPEPEPTETPAPTPEPSEEPQPEETPAPTEAPALEDGVLLRTRCEGYTKIGVYSDSTAAEGTRDEVIAVDSPDCGFVG